MCDPVSIGLALAGAAASTGGQLIKGHEAADNNRRQIEARNAATNAELARQKGFQDQSGGIFDGILGKFAPGAQATGLTGNQAAATTAITGNQPLNVGSILTKGAAPQAAAAEGKTVADAFNLNNARGTALGNLTGYTQQGLGDTLNLADSGRNLGVVSNLSNASASLTPLDREVASNNAYRPPSGLGDILGFVGNVASGYAGRGMPTTSIFGGGAPAVPKPNVVPGTGLVGLY